MNNLKQRIIDYYNPEILGNGEGLFLNVDGKKHSVPKSERNILLTFGADTNQETAEEDIENSKIVKITGIDLYDLFFEWTSDEKCRQLNGYGLRTKAYLDNIKEEMGYIETKNGYEEEKMTDIEKVTIYPSTYSNWLSSDELGKTAGGNWCYQTGSSDGVDDYNIQRIYFAKKPSIDDLQVITELIDLELDFKLRRAEEEFVCWGCDTLTYWLDITGDVREKIKGIRERSCGC